MIGKELSENHPLSLRLEAGKTSTLAAIAALAATGFYIKAGNTYLSQFPTVFGILTAITLIIICLFTIGCLVHMILIGEPSTGEFWDTVSSASEDLKNLNTKALEQIERLEFRCTSLHGPVRPSVLTKIMSARRIAGALERRVQRVHLLMQIGKADTLRQAYDLIQSDLPVDDNFHEQLISSDPIAPIPLEHLLPTLRDLFQSVDVELRTIEEDKRDYFSSYVTKAIGTTYTPPALENEDDEIKYLDAPANGRY